MAYSLFSFFDGFVVYYLAKVAFSFMRDLKGDFVMRIKLPKFIRNKLANMCIDEIEATGVRTDVEISEIVIDTKGQDYTIIMESTIKLNKRDVNSLVKKNIRGGV